VTKSIGRVFTPADQLSTALAGLDGLSDIKMRYWEMYVSKHWREAEGWTWRIDSETYRERLFCDQGSPHLMNSRKHENAVIPTTTERHSSYCTITQPPHGPTSHQVESDQDTDVC
jgi:hypothetical protein